MVPESSQAEEVALYRAVDGAERWERWERVCALLPGVRAVDASLLRHDGVWWMFYAVIGPDKRDQRELHVAHAESPARPVDAAPRESGEVRA